MGMRGQYVMVNEETLESMMELDGAGLTNTLDKLVEDGNDYYDIDKIWEDLHLALTGVSASKPVEGDPLSEAVVGVHVFEVEEEDGFFACTEHDELDGIIRAMKQMDFDKLEPGYGTEALRQELKGEFEALLGFYEKALAAGQHVIFSVV